MSGDTLQTEQDRLFQKRAHRFALVGFGMVVGAVLLSLYPIVLGRQVIEVEILEIDAPVSCRQSSRLLEGGRHRPAGPGAGFPWCGSVHSTYGSLFLPQSTRYGLFLPSRETLHGRLHVGCTYRVTVAGFGRDLTRDERWSDVGTRRILDVEPLEDCPA